MTQSFRETIRAIRFHPAPALRPFLRSFLAVEFPPLYGDKHLPNTSPVAAFSLRGGCQIDGDRTAPPMAFTGLTETLRTHEHRQSHAVLLAIFTPIGAGAILRPPLDEFSGMTSDFADALNCRGECERLHERLVAAETHGGRVEILEQFIISQVRTAEPDPLMGAAVAWIERGTGSGRIRDLAEYIGLSQSALERRFRRAIGVAPKTFASLVRLERAVRMRTTGTDAASVAQAAGYFDQSHFIKAFRHVTGVSPEAFFRGNDSV